VNLVSFWIYFTCFVTETTSINPANLQTNSFLFIQLDKIYKNDLKWPGAIQVERALDYVMIGNVVAGSEKIGIRTAGTDCNDVNAHRRVRDNEVSDFFAIRIIIEKKT